MIESGADEDLEKALKRLRQEPADEGAWEVLFRQTWPFVLALCHRALPAALRLREAEDLAQETYFKLARYWHSNRPDLHDRHGLYSLLAVITRCLARDALRRQGRARRDSRREQPGTSAGPPRLGDYAAVDVRDLLDRVRLQLNEQERRVLGLRLQDYTLAEIAEQLGVSTRTIERDLRRTREVLAPFLSLEAGPDEKSGQGR